MAAPTLAKPGLAKGPCVTQCGHEDCAATRSMADSLCETCGKPIGYETRFYPRIQDFFSVARHLDHAACLKT